LIKINNSYYAIPQ